MKKLIIAAAIMLSGCSTINHGELMGNMQAPQPMDASKITVCRGSFLKVGMDCAELQGWPRLIHPMLAVVFGCTVNWYEHGQISRSVVLSSSDWAMGHEIEHCRGYSDQSLQQSFDPAVVAEKTMLARRIEESYGDGCRPYSPE